MSLTAFFAVCILSIDFMIYFFFKLLYAEKKNRIVQRHLPPEYYAHGFSGRLSRESSSAHLATARKNGLARAKNALSMPAPRPELPREEAGRRQRGATVPPRNSAELLAHRRIVSAFAKARTRP